MIKQYIKNNLQKIKDEDLNKLTIEIINNVEDDIKKEFDNCKDSNYKINNTEENIEENNEEIKKLQYQFEELRNKYKENLDYNRNIIIYNKLEDNLSQINDLYENNDNNIEIIQNCIDVIKSKLDLLNV